MSRKRNRRNRQESPSGSGQEQEDTLKNKESKLGIALAIITAVVIGTLHSLLRSFNQKIVQPALGILKKGGADIVSDKSNGTPKKLAIIYKQYHGLKTVAGETLRGNAECAPDFLRHHDQMTRDIVSQIRLAEGEEGARLILGTSVKRSLNTR